MPPSELDPFVTIFASGCLGLSALVGLYLLSIRARGPWLSYESRRSVPWNALAALLVFIFLANTITSLCLHPKADKDAGTVSAEEDPETKAKKKEPKPNAAERAETLIVEASSLVLLEAAFVSVIGLFFGASRRDFGLPVDRHQAARDVRIGAVAGMAALAPVILMQSGLTYLVYGHEKHSDHPYITMVMSGEPDVMLLILTGLMAVVIAPICEEIAFRVLLQGWLEKWEDERLGWRTENIAAPVANEGLQEGRNEIAHNEGNPAVNEVLPAALPPPQRGIAGLPYGALPIIASAICFGLAHAGYGVQPVPLFFLGLVLGYVYQRTHRIIPGIVAHALFNLFSVVVLWRMVFHPS